jgi:hypothetical protein
VFVFGPGCRGLLHRTRHALCALVGIERRPVEGLLDACRPL